jgi:hypothetical protein
MSKAKSASLAAMFAAKGEAKPADATKPIEAPAVAPVAQSASQPAPVADQPKVTETVRSAPAVQAATMPMATKSLTVKVDVATYGKLKAHGGALGGKTNQDIFIEALGLYFKKYGIQ